jgi:transcriptional regulator NrdR family protein
MICAKCGAWSVVLATRQKKKDRGQRITRERICANEHRFTTVETLVERPPVRGPEYRRRHAAGESIRHIAAHFGVTPDAVRRAINRK